MKSAMFIVLFFLQSIAFAVITPEQYVEQYKNDAINEMYEYGIPASITLAQGMLESNFGNSRLAQNANNHFGIKCHSDWTGATYYMDDDAKDECFRKYDDVLESYRDHSKFLKSRTRYAALFELKPSDYKAWSEGLKAAGYATNPKYPQLLINMIERYSLHQYDTSPKLEIQKDNALYEIFVSKNFVKYVVAKPGDSFQSIAKKMNIGMRRLYKYNDAVDSTSLNPGDFVYLQPKRRKGTEPVYNVGPHESYRDVAQKFSIQLKYLYKKNNILPGTSAIPGEMLFLRKKKR